MTRLARHAALAVVAAVTFAGGGSLQAATVSGEITEHTSANGIVEQCIQIADMPGAHYGKHDRRDETRYCGLDFTRLALCPKLWSTSPGTILYEIDAEAYGGDYAKFEREHCAEGHHARDAALHKPAIFKISVNAADTSATYAPASWTYYHFSRYFRSNVRVPVAVYRSMDARSHHERVVTPALRIVGDRRSVRMLAAGWRYLDAVETGGQAGSATSATLTDEGRQVFGVLLKNKGDRYGAEFNGTRESGWGSGQNHDFQQTAPFLALRSELPLAEAAAWAVREARKNPRMAKALSADTSIEQVVLWMQDVLEITLLDFVLGQQDRIGNIDYNWRWYWIENGALESRSALGKEVPAEIAGFKPVRLKQSAINDNDAGVRRGYADFAQKTHMLEGLRHYDPELYQRLGRLAADLGNQGATYQWMTQSAGLGVREADAIAERAVSAFALLKADCESGALKRDLDLARFLAAKPPGDAGSCEVEPE